MQIPTMTAICFVCNLPILSHQVGLVWAGGNGWDELTRSTLEENTLRQRLGSRRDSAAQVSCLSPPEPDVSDQPRGGPRRRRSSLAQLTDILREWGGGGSAPRRQRAPLSRRETLADLARSLPWARHEPPPRRRRDSSADSGIKSMASKRRDSKAAPQDFRSEFPNYWDRKDSTTIMPSRERRVKRRDSGDESKERRDSVDGHRHRRDSVAQPPRIVATHRKRRASPPTPAPPSFVDASSDPVQQMPCVTVVAIHEPSRSDGEGGPPTAPTMTMPTIITSAVTPSPTSPTTPSSTQASQSTQATQATSTTQVQVTPSGRTPPSLGGRRDSTTQCGRARRDSRAAASPERRLGRLQRQATAFDDPNGPPGPRRRDSGPSLGPDDEGRARRDSLSPDSAARPRRDRSQLSPDRAGGGELSPSAARRRGRLRRQASCARVGRARSPESSSCSSRDPSPCARPPERTIIRRQSTTEEILIARGFRRQSTTEEMIRCRNFRRQSSQSDDACMRARGRRDSSTQILDGTIGTMTVETTSTFFDSSTQTEPSPLYDNNHYHEECLRCNSCGLNLTGPNQKRARRFKNQILCDLHFADVALMECSDFMQQLRSFKPQSLGCAVARRKSSTTLIFPLPPQACSDEFCEEYPHNLIPTPGYWIECSRQKIATDTIWDESESEHDSGPDRDDNGECYLKLPRIQDLTTKNKFSINYGSRFRLISQLSGFECRKVFIKSELKVGVIYVKENQYTEEEILDNNENSPMFEEFLQVLGEKVRLKGFDKYKGGLDTVHDLTGLYSVYTNWRGIEIMFHVSTLLPYERHDPQKLQRKRHIGNDIVCVVFLEADNTAFSPACIKSHFLHTFILVRVSAKIKRRPTRYEVSVVTRDEVGAYKPYLWEQSVFDKGPMFREWLLTKIVNGERASYSAPKFARMQERTRSQMLEDIVANLQNHAETGQIPKPYRRGSWRPIGHMRPSSPLLDSVRDQFEDYDQLAKDFTRVFLNNELNIAQNAQLFDVVFLVGQSKQKTKFIGVRAILGVRSRVFQEMLYGIQTGFGSPQVPVAELLARPAPTLLSPTPARQKSSNFLQVPDIESPRPKSVPSSPMVKRAFSRLGTITAGWGRSIRKQHSQLNAEDKKKWASSQDCSNKDGKDKEKDKNAALAVPRLSVCADAQKVDRAKLAQTEFSIIEFDPETFRILLDYLHTGSCPLTCASIPGLICAAEHYDLPELLQACFHHAKQFLRIEVACTMLISLENYYWRYTSASELVNMILAFIEQRAYALFQTPEFLNLSESMVQMIMCRSLEVPEVRKFEAMLSWARNKIKSKTANKTDAKNEFKCIMERLARDLKLYRISPQELIKVVLPSKAIKNERILETLMYQANSGMYRIQDSYLEACQQRLQKQDSRFSEFESFDYGI
ncbi:hypothetical protein ABMA27_003918 [Loxostege sticticalis]|uniref:Rap-GAP domain-containing protein n=1 Tax=Loxostege sticticalis TaxID=481309 RepID=A0ABR3HQT3_LOXSC